MDRHWREKLTRLGRAWEGQRGRIWLKALRDGDRTSGRHEIDTTVTTQGPTFSIRFPLVSVVQFSMFFAQRVRFAVEFEGAFVVTIARFVFATSTIGLGRFTWQIFWFR